MGTIHDRGIDGLQYSYGSSLDNRDVIQFSVQQDSRGKIRDTLQTLKKEGIPYSRLEYITNQEIKDPTGVTDDFFKEFRVLVIPHDIRWLLEQAHHSVSTMRLFSEFLATNVHIIQSADNLVVQDFAADPRVFVFLRQQMQSSGTSDELRDSLVDSLILYALEGTDPEKKILRNVQEILQQVTKAIKFEVNSISDVLQKRLVVLSTKPKQINHHTKEDAYCLPYETRVRLEEARVVDEVIFADFNKSVAARFAAHPDVKNLSTKQCEQVLSRAICELFKKQGLDFANFLLQRKEEDSIDLAIIDIIERAAIEVMVAPQNIKMTRVVVQDVLRELIYRGTDQELEYLRRLSKTFMLLFLVQCDPTVCEYFNALSSSLVVFVCNSILVPALSEMWLPELNRRHCNLLKGAREAGVRFRINRSTLTELANHIKTAENIYYYQYHDLEGQYESVDAIRYVEHILLRAYFHERLQGDVANFRQFLDRLVSPQSSVATIEQELQILLEAEFGVTFVENEALDVQLDPAELKTLTEELRNFKPSKHQAENDAKTILMIYHLRAKESDGTNASALSFKTWWLSRDTTTHVAVAKCFPKKNLAHCYLRPDFLLNYVSLSLKGKGARSAFDNMFPSLVGVSLSHHVPDEVSKDVRAFVQHHKDLPKYRVQAVVKALTDALMRGEISAKGKGIRHFLDEQLARS